MAEEAKSTPWLKVFGGVGLSGVWGGVTSRVKVGTKYHIGMLFVMLPEDIVTICVIKHSDSMIK